MPFRQESHGESGAAKSHKELHGSLTPGNKVFIEMAEVLYLTAPETVEFWRFHKDHHVALGKKSTLELKLAA